MKARSLEQIASALSKVLPIGSTAEVKLNEHSIKVYIFEHGTKVTIDSEQPYEL